MTNNSHLKLPFKIFDQKLSECHISNNDNTTRLPYAKKYKNKNKI